MKIILFMLILTSFPVRSQDGWKLYADKQLHFTVGYSIGFSIPLLFKKNQFYIGVSSGIIVAGG